MQLEGTSLIGGTRGARGAQTARAVNPSTGAALDPEFGWASPQEVERAVALARAAFDVTRHAPAPRRAALLRTIADGIEASASLIIDRAQRETALPAARLQGELARTTAQLRLFATVVEDGSCVDARIDHGDPSRAPLPKPDVRSLLRPLGPVVVFSSSNFPLAFSVAGGDTASALAAGCPVIVKPHQGHMGTSELVGLVVCEAVRKCEWPEGTFSMLYGPGRKVGMALVKHPDVSAVGFTGSRSGGRALMDAAAARPRPIPVYAEMGSVNPVFLLPGALATRGGEIAKGLHGSVTLGVGQFCTNPGLVFAQQGSELDAMLAALSALISETPAGAMLTGSIHEEYCAGSQRMTSTEGVRHLASGTSSSVDGLWASAALYLTDAETFRAKPTLAEEVFGPSTLVVAVKSIQEMADIARSLEGQLTGTIHLADHEHDAARSLIEAVAGLAGRVVFNGFPTGVEVCHAMHHGGPYPATSDGRSTSVGTRAIRRFARPVCYQNTPEALLPEELRDANPRGLSRLVDGRQGKH